MWIHMLDPHVGGEVGDIQSWRYFDVSDKNN